MHIHEVFFCDFLGESIFLWGFFVNWVMWDIKCFVICGRVILETNRQACQQDNGA